MLAPSGVRRRYSRSRQPKPVTELAGPFKGMRATMRGALDPAMAEWIHNGYPLNPFGGGEIVARPGRQPLQPATGALTQLGGAGTDTRSIQLLHAYANPGSAPESLVCIAAGVLYYWNGALWQEAASAAVLSAAGITLEVQSEYECVEFNGRLFFCGGAINHTFTWNGTVGGGIVNLTATTGAFVRSPTVYAGKLFLIKSNQREIVWSEEGDETTGYEAGAFANVWDLRQTGAAPLIAIRGTNAALYYFRLRGIGAIYGGSADQFQTTSTFDAVSETLGAISSTQVVVGGESLWFLDDQGRPQCFTIGSTEVVPIWHELERAYGSVMESDGRGYNFLAAPEAELASFFPGFGHAVYIPAFNAVAFTQRYLRGASPVSDDVLVLYHAVTRSALGVWSFPTRIAQVARCRMIASQGIAMVDEFGWPYAVAPTVLNETIRPTEVYQDADVAGGADVPVTVSVIGPRHFGQRRTTLRTQRLDVEYVGIEAGTMDVRWVTPSIMAAGGVASDVPSPLDPAQPATLPVDGLATQVGSPVPALPGHAALGLNELGRWIAFGISWDNNATRLRLVGWEVEAIPDGDHPGAR